MPTPLTAQLDRLEDSLPKLPARIVRLQRAVAGATYDQLTGATSMIVEATRSVLSTAQTSGRTVVGQTRAAGTDLAGTARRNTNQVVGQARAQSRRLSASADREATDVIDAAIEAVDDTPSRRRPYEEWTKAELLDRAKELDVPGRYTLNKKQLIAALRRA
jgi:hypothetical protein